MGRRIEDKADRVFCEHWSGILEMVSWPQQIEVSRAEVERWVVIVVVMPKTMNHRNVRVVKVKGGERASRRGIQISCCPMHETKEGILR